LVSSIGKTIKKIGLKIHLLNRDDPTHQIAFLVEEFLGVQSLCWVEAPGGPKTVGVVALDILLDLAVEI